MSSFSRINLTIQPNQEISQEAIRMADSVTQDVPSYFGVDGVHYFPHITVYSPEYPAKNINKVFEAIENVISDQQSFEVEFGKVTTHWGYIDVEIQPNKQLQSLHEALVTKLNPLREGHFREKDKDPQSTGHFSEEQKQTLLEYGYADSMELYRPHLTFARLESEVDAEERIKKLQWPHKTLTVDTLGAFEMGDHGTCVKLVKTFTLSNTH